jgi:hypothetical protein
MIRKLGNSGKERHNKKNTQDKGEVTRYKENVGKRANKKVKKKTKCSLLPY